MTVSMGAAYGMPPLSLQDATAGSSPATNPLNHPAKRFGFSAYALLLIAVAILYFWKGRK